MLLSGSTDTRFHDFINIKVQIHLTTTGLTLGSYIRSHWWTMTNGSNTTGKRLFSWWRTLWLFLTSTLSAQYKHNSSAASEPQGLWWFHLMVNLWFTDVCVFLAGLRQRSWVVSREGFLSVQLSEHLSDWSGVGGVSESDCCVAESSHCDSGSSTNCETGFQLS